MIVDNKADTSRHDQYEFRFDDYSGGDNDLQTLNPWFKGKFRDFKTAREYQSGKLRLLLDKGYAIRQCEMSGDTDYDTKIYWWVVFVRGMKPE